MSSTVDAGLCGRCAWSRSVAGAVSTFIMCRRGLSDPAFAKYPTLPVLTCRGYEPVEPPPDKGEAAP